MRKNFLSYWPELVAEASAKAPQPGDPVNTADSMESGTDTDNLQSFEDVPSDITKSLVGGTPIHAAREDIHTSEGDTPTIFHDMLGWTVEHSFNSPRKPPILIYGLPGVGKSAAIKDAFNRLSKTTPKKSGQGNRIPVKFQSISREEQNKVIDNPGDYFVLIDVRTAALESSDFMGLPVGKDSDGDEVIDVSAAKKALSNVPRLKTVKFKWAYVACHPDAAGFLFFDEINQGDPRVLKAMYSVVHPSDRFLFDRPLSPNICVMAAGNLAGQDTTAQNDNIPQALLRRFQGGTYNLVVEAADWLAWAKKNKVHPAVVGCVESNQSKNFYRLADGDNDRSADPDSFVALSNQLYQIDKQFFQSVKAGETIDLAKQYIMSSQSIVGKQWTEDFADFLQSDIPSFSDTEKYTEAATAGTLEKWRLLTYLQLKYVELVSTDPELKTPTGKWMFSQLQAAAGAVGPKFQAALDELLESHKTVGVNLRDLKLIKFKAEDAKKPEHFRETDVVRSSLFQNTKNAMLASYSDKSVDTNLPTVKHYEMLQLLDRAYETKEALLIYGGIGIGKSWAIEKFAKSKAAETPSESDPSKPRIYVHYNKLLTNDQAGKVSGGYTFNDVYNNPGDFFILLDIRLAGSEPTDFMGIPDIEQRSSTLETRKFEWVALCTKPGAVGILFFDEMNQADLQTLKSMFPIIHSDDRTIFDTKISPGISIVAAGNLASQDITANNAPLPKALTRRFKGGTVVLDVTGADWLLWAKQNKIHSWIINFVSDDPDRLVMGKTGDGKDYTPERAPVTPDTLRALSDALKELMVEYKQTKQTDPKTDMNWLFRRVKTVVSGIAGASWSKEFFSWLYTTYQHDWGASVAQSDVLSNKPSKATPTEFVQGTNRAIVLKISNILDTDTAITKPENQKLMAQIITLLSRASPENLRIVLSSLAKRGMLVPTFNIPDNTPGLDSIKKIFSEPEKSIAHAGSTKGSTAKPGYAQVFLALTSTLSGESSPSPLVALFVKYAVDPIKRLLNPEDLANFTLIRKNLLANASKFNQQYGL